MRRRLLAHAILLLALTAASAQGAAAGRIVVENSVAYGQAGETVLELDLARPAEGEGPFPGLIFIHGGGWFQGNRTAHLEHAKEAARRGYVAATITYRLMKIEDDKRAEPNFPAQVHDAKAAIRWLRANAKKYNVDPDRIGVGGASAGGHLSLMVGFADADDKLEGDSGHPGHSSRVQAVVNFFGPTEMASCAKASSVDWIFWFFLDGKPDENPKLYKAASPVAYITQDDPPVLTLQGDKDKLVPVAQAKLLDEKLRAAGVPHTLKIFPGEGHGFSANVQKTAMEATWNFLDQHLKPQQ